MSFAGNPRANQPHPSEVPQESTGPVASDSLAAESLENKGGFSENKSAAALGVRGDQSTLANTETSGANILHPASDAVERERQDALGRGADEQGVAGLKYQAGVGKPDFGGTHSDQGYAGGPSGGGSGAGSSSHAAGGSDFGASALSSTRGDDSQIRSGSDLSGATSSSTGGPATGTGVRPHVDQAPNYTATVTGAAAPHGTYQPKGANLDDADQSNSIPQTKTFTGAVGTVNDPGRLAEREFQGRNEDPIGELGQAGVEAGRQRGAEGDQGQYGVLESERA